MHKFIRTFSIVIIRLFSLAVFGWMSVHKSKGDKNFGFLNEPMKFMYSFLDQFEESVKEIQKKSLTFLKTEDHHRPINKLYTDIHILATYSESDHTRTVVVMNLRNDSILYKWSIIDSVKDHDRKPRTA